MNNKCLGVFVKFIDNNNTVVVLGSWNVSIFTPDWVKKYIFNDIDVKAEILLDSVFSIHLTADDFQIFVSPNRLAITNQNKDDDSFKEIQDIVMKLADYLPHTPVSAFGINFRVQVDEKTKIFEKAKLPFYKELVKKGTVDYEIKYTVNRGKSGQMTLNVSEKESICEFDVNFHFNIKKLADLKQTLLNDSESILDYKAKTEDVVLSLIRSCEE